MTKNFENLASYIACALLTQSQVELSEGALQLGFGLNLKILSRTMTLTYDLLHIDIEIYDSRAIFRQAFDGKLLHKRALKEQTLTWLSELVSKFSKDKERIYVKQAVIISELASLQINLLEEENSNLNNEQIIYLLKAFQIAGKSRFAQRLLSVRRNAEALLRQDPYLHSICKIRHHIKMSRFDNTPLRDFIQIEDGNSEVHTQYVSDAFNFTTSEKFRAVLGIYKLFSQSLFLVLQKPLLNWKNVTAWVTEKEHWQSGNRVLASYWFGPYRSNRPAQQMLNHALFSDNLIIKLRALDWSSFVLSHGIQIPFLNSIYKFLNIATKRWAPFLNCDVAMHQSILFYYQGDLCKSLLIQSENEKILSEGNHDFNRLVNLSNAMRTALVAKFPDVVNLIYQKSIGVRGFQSGPLKQRTRLNFLIQQLRLVGRSADIDSGFAEIESRLNSLPSLQKITTTLLLTVAYFEMGQIDKSRQLLAAAKSELENTGFIFPYRKIFYAINSLINSSREKTFYLTFFGKDWKTLSRQKNLNISRKDYQSIIKNFSDANNLEKLDLPHWSLRKPFAKTEELLDYFIKRFAMTHPTSSIRFIATGGVLAKNEIFEPPDEVSLFLDCREKLATLSASDLKYQYTFFGKQSGWLICQFSFAETPMEIRIGSFLTDRSHLHNIVSENILFMKDFILAFKNILDRDRRLVWAEKEAEEKKHLAIAETAKQVAHDIRSPLSALNLVMENLTEAPHDTVAIVKSAVQRINDIANDLLSRKASTQAASGVKNDFLLSKITLSPLMERVLSEQQIQFENQIRFQLDMDFEDEPYVMGNPTELMRAFSNLITNSVESFQTDSPRNMICPEIKISLTTVDDQISIRIADNGVGIPSHIIEKIGKPGLSYGKDGLPSAGSGLGVYHAKKAIEAMSGTLKFESSLNAGTVVSVRLPLVGVFCGSPKSKPNI